MAPIFTKPMWRRMLLGVLATGVATVPLIAQDAPPLPSPQAADAPAPPTVLLLTNGHVFEGEIKEDATGYYLRHRIGVKQFARRNVAGVFRSLAEAYDFQRARLPKNDPDEHMRLARWCLEHKLVDQAKQELNAVLALTENPQAKAMLFHLDAKAGQELDPNVARAAANVADVVPPGAPQPLNPRVLTQLAGQRNAVPAGPPRVLDLPVPLAVKRYQEFARYVHLPLQNHCARCHDAENPNNLSTFRLYRAQSKRDLQSENVIRANLEATLDLVNPDDLAHSNLLSAAGLTHPPDGKPVLGGPSHPTYKVLQTWVTSLYDPAGPNALETARGEGSAVRDPQDPNGEDDTPFAAGRSAPANPPAANAKDPAPLDSTAGSSLTAPPRVARAMSGSRTAAAPGTPRDVEFPNPSAPQVPGNLAVPPDKDAPTTPAAAPTQQSAATATPKLKPAKGPNMPSNVVEAEDGVKYMRLPNGQLLPYVSAADQRAEPAPGQPDPAKPKSDGQTKPKMDNKTLQNYMQRRAATKAK